MSDCSGTPKAAGIAISDLLDQCAQIKPGQEVVILGHIDGLYGGDNLVDQEAVSWIQSAVQSCGANASVLWIDEPAKPHAWRVPPIVQGAMERCDVFISHSFELTNEEMMDLRKYFLGTKKLFVRNFATTAPLLCSSWAQTPLELVSEIRRQSSTGLKLGEKWVVDDINGTHLEGIIDPAYNPKNYFFDEKTGYITTKPRASSRPWPEWMHPLISISGTSGVLVFDRMLSWWSRYIGVSPYFAKPVRLTIENNIIVKIEGGEEAAALTRFLNLMKGYLGAGVFDFNAMHFGVHPQAFVSEHQCPNILHRRLIEHSQTSTVHFHIGAPKATESYPYWMHCTGDIRSATLRIGNHLVHDRGHLTALDSPAVLAVAEKYPGRPGLKPEPVSY
jgi:hypothetical protein